MFGYILKMRDGSKENANANARSVVLNTLINTLKKNIDFYLPRQIVVRIDFYFKVS